MLPNKETHRWLSRKDLANELYSAVIHELEYCSQIVEHLETPAQAARYLRRRINKLLEEKVLCRLKE